MKTAAEIREDFLTYFGDRGHKRVKSSSLVPKNDPTLLFTNAGMNQFKDVFLGHDTRDYNRAASSQKCMRVSGKHNDLETVGRTPRHHTFFEMLGNFSFGDYFKREAVEFAWELCTEVYRLDKKRLIVTVFEQDDDAFRLWAKHIGVPEPRIYRCGAKDNFWAMGETGPCGPCSELHYDMGDRVGDKTSPFGDESTDRFVEIWNLVFMQYDRDAAGKMTPLPSPSIDTGMGLERITCVLQQVASNYDTDLFTPIIEEASRLIGVPYGQDEKTDTSLRILADHSRACMFLINDGVVPGNEGRGYVLRKILRRAIRQGKLLGKEEPFIFTLTSLVGELMSAPFPELKQSREYAAKVVKNEEEKFSTTLSFGLQLLEEIFEKQEQKNRREVSGTDLFRLYDTYGFPLDIAREVARDRGFSLDEAGFEQELEKQRQRARASWKGGHKEVKDIYRTLADRGFETEFTGYDRIREVKGTILAALNEGQETKRLATGDEGEVVLDRSPFYAEAGGQVGDQGIMENETLRAEVLDVYRPVGRLRLHRIRVTEGGLRPGDTVTAGVSPSLREDTQRNHTATHLLHAALRRVVGPHVKQAGSLVAPERLRFDFTHYQQLSQTELDEIEQLVNQKIRENIPLETELRDLDEAIQAGAMALFGEKYDQKVRVVKIGDFSLELCGGTHTCRTGDIAVFKLTSESSISAGVRRVEAVTGQRAVARFCENEQLLRRLAADLNSSREHLDDALSQVLKELRRTQKELEKTRLELARGQTAKSAEKTRTIKGIRVLAQRVENTGREALRHLAAQLRNQVGSGVVVLGTSTPTRVNLVAMVSEDLTDRIRADVLIREISKLVKGGGGGKPDMAEAGGSDPNGLDRAIDRVYDLVRSELAQKK